MVGAAVGTCHLLLDHLPTDVLTSGAAAQLLHLVIGDCPSIMYQKIIGIQRTKADSFK